MRRWCGVRALSSCRVGRSDIAWLACGGQACQFAFWSLGFLDPTVGSPYKVSMPEVVHKVLADPILVGMILFAAFLNAGALGLKWERRRETMGDTERGTRSQ